MSPSLASATTWDMVRGAMFGTACLSQAFCKLTFPPCPYVLLSHAFCSPDKKWCHEDASLMMFDALLEDNGLEFDEDDALFVKAMIMGNPDMCK